MPSNRDSFERFLPILLSDDRDGMRALLTDDAVYHAPPFSAERYGAIEGAEAVVDFLCSAGDEFYEPGSFSFTPEVDALEGDRALALVWLSARTAKGTPYENRYAFAFRFRDGAICEIWELLDSAHFQQLTS